MLHEISRKFYIDNKCTTVVIKKSVQKDYSQSVQQQQDKPKKLTTVLLLKLEFFAKLLRYTSPKIY